MRFNIKTAALLFYAPILYNYSRREELCINLEL